MAVGMSEYYARHPVATTFNEFDELFVGPQTKRRWRWLTTLLPFVASILMVGPGLRRGALLNMDLVIVPNFDLPSALVGLGPDLPRRLPLWAPLALISQWVSGEFIGKVLIAGGIAFAWLGMVRLLKRTNPWTAHCAGLIYALSPFLLTRAGVGHLSVTVAATILPWALPTLTRPGRDIRSTFVAAAALGLAGSFGGLLAVTFVVVAIITGERKRSVSAVLTTLVAQASWVVPAVLIPSSTSLDTNFYPTAVNGVRDVVRLSSGQGFWNEASQIGASARGTFGLGFVLLMFALIGHRDLPRHLRRPLAVLGAAGWLAAIASSIGAFDRVVDAVTSNPILNQWREPQQLLLFHLAWLAPAAALGGARFGRAFHDCRVKLRIFLKVVPVAAALGLAAPGAWGLDGNIAAHPMPTGWEDIRLAIEDEPGTVLALPWARYLDVEVAPGRTRLMQHPLPLVLGGDVITAPTDRRPSGPPLGLDRRAELAAELVDDLRSGQLIGADLAGLGVRWVVLLKTDLAGDYQPLAEDDGLKVIIDSPSAIAYEVQEWRGPATLATGDQAGRKVSVSMLAPGIARVDSSKEVVWNFPGQNGWRRGGWGELTVTDDGRLLVPAGRGILWQWRALPVIASQGVWLVALLLALGDGIRSLVGRQGRRRWGANRYDTWDRLLQNSL